MIIITENKKPTFLVVTGTIEFYGDWVVDDDATRGHINIVERMPARVYMYLCVNVDEYVK